ncbi:PH domain-containing protein [Paenibacillus sp. JX-17]|uniref:PH domain-containing protein n=1 Tax=Paenibacillus lacisoli TaxID=3064525 RepID=A0ABT9CBX7_9BACL|nr:PH domain-containing protein [Paenibacillus sp. JX-17]MDO7906769.1 PH domain-containing protein [Paenibacillus sp. JX-17]
MMKLIEKGAFRPAHPETVRTARISALLFTVPGGLAAAVWIAAAYLREWPVWPAWIGAAAAVILAVWYAGLSPSLVYSRYAYRLSDEEMEIRAGLIWRKETLIPMTRVQHVELESGPLLRRYGLAEVKVVTAATTHTIRGLKQMEAEQVKRQIGELAKVVDDDE